MKIATVILFLAGLALLTGLVAWQGVGTLAGLLGDAGWGLLWLCVFHLAVIWMGAMAWRLLFPRPQVPAWLSALYATWVGLAVNWLLPAGQVGGEVVRARLLIKRGIEAGESAATVVVDKTIQTFTQPLFALIGLALFAAVASGRDVVIAALAFSILLAAGCYGFYRVQQAGVFSYLARFADRLFKGRFAADLSESAGRVDEAVRAVYDRRKGFFGSSLWRMAYRVALAGEIWLVMFLLGHPIGVIDALIIESLSQIIVAVAFAVPAALGVQEGGIVLVAVALGISPDIALALALARRARELAVGVPGLIVWQVEEGRAVAGWWRGKAKQDTSAVS